MNPQSSTASPIDHLTTQDGYDRWSSIYDSEDNPLIALEEPRVAELLGNVAGLRIADVGCGTGRHSIQLARAGATVTALDFSEGMLQKGRDKGVAGITFIQHDLGLPLPLPDGGFDRVICCLVLEHIANLDLLFRELGRICKKDGFIVVSAMHPAMMLKGVQARFTDPQTGRETRPQSHANQISDFVMAAIRAKLHIDHLSEHAVDDVLAARSPRSKKYLGWPMLFMMRLLPRGRAS